MSSPKNDEIPDDYLAEDGETKRHCDALLQSSFLHDPGLDYETDLANLFSQIEDLSAVIKAVYMSAVLNAMESSFIFLSQDQVIDVEADHVSTANICLLSMEERLHVTGTIQTTSEKL